MSRRGAKAREAAGAARRAQLAEQAAGGDTHAGELLAPQIFAAMVEISRAVGIIPKGDQASAEAGGFWYRGIDFVVANVAPHLAAAGVWIAPELIEWSNWQFQTKQGKTMQAATVRVRHRFYATDGSHVDVTTGGTASDSGDRAMTQAQTAAFRDALLTAFAIPVQAPMNAAPAPPGARAPAGAAGGEEPLSTEDDVHELREAMRKRAGNLGATGEGVFELAHRIEAALLEKSQPKLAELEAMPARWKAKALAWVERWEAES